VKTMIIKSTEHHYLSHPVTKIKNNQSISVQSQFQGAN
jgi:hypothetical protein